jgi:hypothetical protein
MSLPVTPTKQIMRTNIPSSGPSSITPLNLAEFGADSRARGSADVVFGFSNQKNRRAVRIRRSSFDAPELMNPSPTSTTSSSPTTTSPGTPSPSAHQSRKVPEKKSFFNLKNASTPNFSSFGRSLLPPTPSPTKPSGPIGLGINMAAAVERTAPIPASHRFTARKGLKSQPVSRLFKVGKGTTATYFEPVPQRQPAIAGPSSVLVEREGLGAEANDDGQDDEDSSDDEFVSYHDSYEDLISSYMSPPEGHAALGPSNLAELMALRESTERIYSQAINQAGPSTPRRPSAAASRLPKRLPRKAVPSYLDAVAQAEPVVDVPATIPSPVIPERMGSLPITPTLESEMVYDRRAESHHARTSSRESSDSSSSSLMDDESSRDSLCSSISSLASPTMSESGSMPVTPLTATQFPQSSPFFVKEKTFELDVASVFFAPSPPHNNLELPATTIDLVSPNKSFYQNQAATQSSWAILTSKFKQPSSQEKTRFKKFFGKS